MFRFLVLVSKNGSETFWEMLGDQLSGQARKSDKVATTNCSEECGRDRAAKGSVKINGELLLRSVGAKDAVGLMEMRCGTGRNWRSKRASER